MAFDVRSLGFAPFLLTVLAGCAAADDCGFLKRDPLELRDRQVFFQLQGSATWLALDSAAPDLVDQAVSYAYVIRENRDPGRSGVVVLKSARLHRPDEPRKATKTVLLVRHAEAVDNKSCGAISDFGERRISAKSYDDFHDLGMKVPEMKTIAGFHIKYAARLKHCRLTDDNSPDSIAPRDSRSNRGQFSFNDDVVARETYSQALNVIGISSAYASYDTLEDQRVEIKQYQVSANFPTCVRFSLPPQGKSSFLRVNDLEALKRPDSGNGYVRADEQGWALSR
jgi:hypothetical protein